MSLTYDRLYYLAKGLDVSISALFVNKPDEEEVQVVVGRRHVGALMEGDVMDLRVYLHRYLCNELVDKLMMPVVTEVTARSLDEFLAECGDMIRHPGEEFSCVLEGVIEVHSKYYAPTRLVKGEYIYFDSSTPHAYINAGNERALMLTICSPATAKPRLDTDKLQA